MSMGFIFDNKHSGDMGVVFKSTDRTLLPAKRVTQYTIPGKSGTYDIEDGYENREIVCTVAFVGELPLRGRENASARRCGMALRRGLARI